MAGGGLCIYRRVLENPMLPPDQVTKFRVVRGHLERSEARFSSIRSLANARGNVDLPYERLYYLLHGSVPLSVDTIIHESNYGTELELVYKINYLDVNNQNSSLWLGPGNLLQML